jgi:hypothetical protein
MGLEKYCLQLLEINSFSISRETVDEMYRGEFDTETSRIALNIEDTGGNYFQVRN